MGIKAWSTAFQIWNADDISSTAWASAPDGSIQTPFRLPYNEDIFFKQIYGAKQRGEDFFVMESHGKELEETYKYMFNLPGVKKYFDDAEDSGFSIPIFQITHCAFFSQGYLMFITYEPVPEMWDVFKRFAKVFEQTYTRFLDLQKAEAQAREAEIELALERVRAKSMAMQRSDELQDVVDTVFARLNELHVELYTAIIIIFSEGSKDIVWWMQNRVNQQYSRILIKYADKPYLRHLFEAREKGEEMLSRCYINGEKKEFYDYLFEHTDLRQVPEEQKKFLLESKFATMSVALAKNIGIHITSYSKKSFSDSEKEILKRFAKVFDQSYTRFLDLQKAEAQAREAQIETALEKIRSRTMGMQKSDELKEVIQVVYEQFIHLKILVEHAGFIMDYKARDDMHIWLADKHVVPFQVTIPYFDCAHWNSFKEAKAKGLDFFSNHLSFEEKNKFYQDLFKLIPGLPEETLEYYFSCSGLAISTVLLENVGLYIENFSGIPYTDEENATLMRFGKVFQQTYTRFLDLQKAEAQAREAHIEAALERVRSKAMAMHKSEDLNAAVAVVFEELEKLDLGVLRCGISVLNREKRIGDVWATSTTAEGPAVQVSGDESFDIHPLLAGAFDAWLRQEDFDYVLEGDDLTNYYKAVKAARFQLPESQFISSESEFRRQYAYVAVYHAGGLFAFRETEFPDEAKKVMKRFANVFDLTYKRFIDLQKAEAQAREAQIEAALERVRSRTMAMHRSQEIGDIVGKIFSELSLLDLVLNRVLIWIFNDEERYIRWWSANPEVESNAESYRVDYNDTPVFLNYLQAWQKRLPMYLYTLSGDTKKNWEDHLFTNTELSKLPMPVRKGMREEGTIFTTSTTSDYGLLMVGSFEPLSDTNTDIIQRFGRVFQQSYTRYLDVQNAEVQAREAQIEAAMEKVRSRAMAMQKAEELIEVAQLLRKEMGLLGVEELETSSIYIHHEDAGTTECWYAIQDIRENDKKLVTDHMTINLNDTWVGREMFRFYHSDKKEVSILMQGDNRKEWINYCSLHSKVLDGYYGDMIPERTYHLVKFSNGYMGAASPGDISDESWDLLRRATNVFSLAYTRFSDLQLAEAQAREATIEAALERVRAKAMAMHNTTDLSSASSTAFAELRKLGINPIRFGVGLLSKESRKALLYSATSSAEGENLALVGWVMLSGHPVLEDIYESWVKGEDIFPELSGEQLKLYYEKLLSGLSVPSVNWKAGDEQFGHFFPFSVGCLYAWAEKPFNDAEIKILKRFASIIDLTFRRYMDLQKSEANTREAVKQAALDRVRAEIASMRTVGDLERITPLIWNELTALGVPFIRCGVFLMDETQQLIHTFLSTPDGKAIAAFHIPYATPGNMQQVLRHWQQKERYSDHWDEEAFVEFANTLVRQGALESPEQYLQTLPPGGFYLHFVPFLQGMLYVGNTAELNEEQINLVQAVADAFSTAYARYEDFNRLEAAKQQIEKTLSDLRQTQQQLVQSEKMASLGELTAGIAHEIQNPLNFVNNFSEVNNELIEELKSQRSKLKSEEQDDILNDIFLNNEKILHHGKRADTIVKGMLQHSRTSSGQKELTDINALADEYLRLAYHGLRAKDKTFNAKFEIDLDKTIEKINVMPQEIGRVILNLINNAFYTVTEKKRQLNGTYEPTVLVSTRKVNGKIEIKVKDNGNGIPQKVMEKIFQPFFTTKPTGQGTGLGLSLSYDIITKGHGGELRVETNEGQGSEFIIQLPA
ncbi:MAG TPA: ATP-binding protein [Chitinophagaceae bacterium]|nr:ATP-binding protein [Chitinophagaceae bacterium]